MNAFSITISVISLIIALYSLWVTRLSRFNLQITSTSRLTLTSNPNSPNARQPAISLQLLFSNNGAKSGYINDVAIAVKNSISGKTTILRSLYEHLENELNLTNQLPPPKLIPFTSFHMAPNSMVAKMILFVPLDIDDDLVFEKSSYEIIPYTSLVETKPEWKKYDSIKFDISAEDLTMLSKKEVTHYQDGSQFVKWVLQSKTIKRTEQMLSILKGQVAKTNLQIK